MDKLTEQVILDILGHEIGIPEARRIILNQNFKMPDGDDSTYLAAGVISAQPFANRSVMTTELNDDAEPQQVETNYVQQREAVQIDIFGRTNDVLYKRAQVVSALHSIYSQQQQEFYGFKLGIIPVSFVNSSSAEGGSQLNRFSITISCLVWYKTSKILSEDSKTYYDDFKTRVDDAQTIGTPNGLIEFEIKEDTII